MAEPNVVPIPRQHEQQRTLALIERLANNPGTDLAYMKELLDFQRELLKDARLEAFNRDYVELQGRLDPVAMRGIIDIGGRRGQQKYAMFEDLHSSIRIPMRECGFGLSFRIADPEQGVVAVTTLLIHKDGHREDTTIRLPYDTSGSKNNVQSRGSSISYGRRYGAMAILNLASTNEDDDGQAGGGNAPITEEQLAKIEQLIVESKANVPLFCEYMGVKEVGMIRSDKFDEAVSILHKKIADNKKKSEMEASAAQNPEVPAEGGQ